MNKVNILLILASLFVAFVMISVLRGGVQLKERKMVKWSKVESASMAGEKIARFMFPLLKEFQEVRVIGSTSFAKEFYESFLKQAQSDKTSAQIFLNQTKIEKSNSDASQDQVLERKVLVLSLVDLGLRVDEEACEKGDKPSCIARKSLKKLNKKDPDSGLWINMFRFEENQLLFFYLNMSA